ncbi:transcriptional regulator [Streptomyces ruber]|uniref:Transcriptional regulator n=2 Tax=Streptomyces TaxID=1883 RepID=A0A918EMU5_9ACTN|nr:GAF and ANTAR domain-containing protein [Streptomyces ruber]GGQ38612.1 transcriptional regulator [Streptomyces ruber]
MALPEQLLADVCVELAGSGLHPPGGGPGLPEVLARRTVELLGDCTAAAVSVWAEGGDGTVVAASDPAVRDLTKEAADWKEGPGHDCGANGVPVEDAAFGDPAVLAHWPRYAPRARELGHVRVAARPLRADSRTLGALTLFSRTRLDCDTLALGQSLADIAAISLDRERKIGEGRVLVGQLEHALNSRVLIEQAKGMLAARLAVEPQEAFALLRRHARSHNRVLRDVAREVIDGRLTLLGGPDT